MEEIKLTIQQAQNAFNKSRNTIYYWTNTGKVNYEDSDTGRILIFTKEEYDKLLKQYNPYYNSSPNIEYKLYQDDPIEHNIEYKVQNNTSTNKRINPEMQYIIDTYLGQIKELNSQLLEYAEQAGQVKLLTDNNKFYQDEYFRLKYDNEQLTNLHNSNLDKIRELESKINYLNTENNELRSKLDKFESKWWNKSVFKNK